MGKKVFTLQTLPAKDEQHYGQLAQIGGFSLHAGVFAPNSHVRAEVSASQRGKNSPRLAEHLTDSDKPYHARSMSWAQRLTRVFNIDITVCEACKKTNVKIIACITEPAVIQKILIHLDKPDSLITANTCRAPPVFKTVQPSIIDDYTIQRDFDFGA